MLELEMFLPKRLSDITLFRCVASNLSDDPLKTLLVGSFNSSYIQSVNSHEKKTPNVTIKPFLLSHIDELKASTTIIRSIDAAKAITCCSDDSKGSSFVPQLITILRASNAIHLVFKTAIVCDLSTVLYNMSHLSQDDLNDSSNHSILPHFQISPELSVYISACILRGLDVIHAHDIVYRSIYPESICVDNQGRIVLMDYRVAKAGVTGKDKTYTICGVADYLTPEQISQRGHNGSVDIWQLGVLLYEMLCGSHPFLCTKEKETFQKITSFGSHTFPELIFPQFVPSLLQSLIQRMIAVDPLKRAGWSSDSIANNNQFFEGKYKDLYRHKAYSNINWHALDHMKSPIENFIQKEKEAIYGEELGVAWVKLLRSFDTPFTSATGWEHAIDIETQSIR